MPYGLHAHKSGLLPALDVYEQLLMKGGYLLGTIWYIFRFQDGYELPEHGCLLGLVALEGRFQRC